MKHASLWSHNKRFGMTMYSNNTAKSVWTKDRLSFLSYFSSKIIFFPSTVPPVPYFFCLLCLTPSPLISISHPILNPFLRPLFILSIMRFYFSSFTFFFCLFFPPILHYVFPLRLSIFISSVLSSFHSSLRYYFDIFLLCVCFSVLPTFCQNSLFSFLPSILLLLLIFIILIFPLPVFVFVFSCLLVTDILLLSFQTRCKLCRTSIMHLVTVGTL
jgi:hypothetical protein